MCSVPSTEPERRFIESTFLPYEEVESELRIGILGSDSRTWNIGLMEYWPVTGQVLHFLMPQCSHQSNGLLNTYL